MASNVFNAGRNAALPNHEDTSSDSDSSINATVHSRYALRKRCRLNPKPSPTKVFITTPVPANEPKVNVRKCARFRDHSNSAIDNKYPSADQTQPGKPQTKTAKFNPKTIFVGLIFLFVFFVIQLASSNTKNAQPESERHRLIVEELKVTLLQEIKETRLECSARIDDLQKEIELSKSLLNHLLDQNQGKEKPSNIAVESYKSAGKKQAGDKVTTFRNSIVKLKNEIHGQFTETWKELYSGIVDTLTSSTSRPGSIVILVPSSMETSDFPACFVKNIASTINTAHGKEGNHIKEINPAYLDSFPAITNIQDDIKKYLTSNGKSIIVDDLDKIQREDYLMLFQTFCDNVMAFDNAATFLFVVRVPEKIGQYHGWRVSEGQKIARNILHHSWKSAMSLDKRVALMARISVNVILLKDGGKCHEFVKSN